MNVPNIDIGAGSLRAVPRTDGSGQSTPPAHTRPSHSSGSTTSGISLTRLAWFDANGDGRIDPRAAGSGGDATLLVPAHQVDLPTYGRAAPPEPGARPTPANGTGEASHSPAEAQRAVAAYQRYGQPPAEPVPTANVPGSTPAVPTAAADAISATPAPSLPAVPLPAVA